MALVQKAVDAISRFPHHPPGVGILIRPPIVVNVGVPNNPVKIQANV
jgi:hypothetical protein